MVFKDRSMYIYNAEVLIIQSLYEHNYDAVKDSKEIATAFTVSQIHN